MFPVFPLDKYKKNESTYGFSYLQSHRTNLSIRNSYPRFQFLRLFGQYLFMIIFAATKKAMREIIKKENNDLYESLFDENGFITLEDLRKSLIDDVKKIYYGDQIVPESDLFE